MRNHRQYVLVSERRLVFMWGDVWAPRSHYHVNVWAMIRCHHTTLDIPHTPSISTHLLLWRVLIIQRYQCLSFCTNERNMVIHLFTFSHIIEQKKSTILITNRFWDFLNIDFGAPELEKVVIHKLTHTQRWREYYHFENQSPFRKKLPEATGRPRAGLARNKYVSNPI